MPRFKSTGRAQPAAVTLATDVWWKVEKIYQPCFEYVLSTHNK
jgi:hypothetical protein